MPAFEEELIFGAVPTDAGPVDEPNLAVKNVDWQPTRDKKTYENAKGSTFGVKYRNPLLVIAFTAEVSAYAGLADQHPGTEATSIQNWQATKFGFNPADGATIFEDPQLSQNSEGDLPELGFNVINYPFVDTAQSPESYDDQGVIV